MKNIKVVILDTKTILLLRPFIRILFAWVWVLAISENVKSQPPSPPKIKVILFGTFHYGETTDRNKTGFPDLFGSKRQQELEQIAQTLALQHPDKIILEAEPRRQSMVDSLYLQYQQHRLDDSSWLRNEIVQLGFRVAARTNGKARLVCADHQQALPYAAVQAYEEKHRQDSNPPFFNTPWPFSNTGRLKLEQTDLRRYYLQLNSKEDRQRAMYDYLHYALLYGKGNDYTGVDFSASWYARNFKIMANVFRSLETSDTCILLIMGSSHTAVLHELLTDHPRFDIVELESIL